jgi:hypothetical protein
MWKKNMQKSRKCKHRKKEYKIQRSRKRNNTEYDKDNDVKYLRGDETQ